MNKTYGSTEKDPNYGRSKFYYANGKKIPADKIYLREKGMYKIDTRGKIWDMHTGGLISEEEYSKIRNDNNVGTGNNNLKVEINPKNFTDQRANVLTDGTEIRSNAGGLYVKPQQLNGADNIISGINNGAYSSSGTYSTNTTPSNKRRAVPSTQNPQKVTINTNGRSYNGESIVGDPNAGGNSVELNHSGFYGGANTLVGNGQQISGGESIKVDGTNSDEIKHEKNVQRKEFLSDNAKIGALAELIGIGMNSRALIEDSNVTGPDSLRHPTNATIRVQAPDLINPAKEAINANTSRGIIATREMGAPENISGIIANSNKAVVDATVAQGNAELDAVGKTMSINTQNEKFAQELGTKIDMYNDEAKRKFLENKFKVVNADKNALYKGVKNIAAVKIADNQYKANQEYLRSEAGREMIRQMIGK